VTNYFYFYPVMFCRPKIVSIIWKGRHPSAIRLC